MQTYGFMRIYDLRRGDNDRRTARLDQALCIAVFVSGVVFSDTRMLGMADAMWQSGLPLFSRQFLVAVRWVVGTCTVAVLLAFLVNGIARMRRGVPLNGVKLLLVGVTGWFWWYCGWLSTNLLVGVAMFEIYHAVQYNAIVWIYNRRLFERAGGKFGPLGFLFRDRLAMLGVYLGAIAAYSSIRYFTASPNDRMFSAEGADAHQWLIAAFVTSAVLHFYYDGFIWKVSERRTQENLVDENSSLASPFEKLVPATVHAGKWVVLASAAGFLLAAEWRHLGTDAAARAAAERQALAELALDVPDAAMLASLQAFAEGDAETAVALAQKAAAARPTSARSQAELAWALMHAGDFAAAKTAIERAIALAPEAWEYRCDLGEVCEQLTKSKTAEDAYRRAMALAPDEAEPRDRLSALLLRTGRAPEATPLLRSLVDNEKPSAEVSFRLGVALHSQGDVHGALTSFQRAVDVDSRHAPSWLQLGNIWLSLAKPQAAAEAFQRAAGLEPARTQAWVGWADALLQLGDATQAEQVLRHGVQAAPDSGDLCLALGLLLQQSGSDESAQWLRRAKQHGLDVEAATLGF
jgi:tetratricopeptide (TPR) repeat protein